MLKNLLLGAAILFVLWSLLDTLKDTLRQPEYRLRWKQIIRLTGQRFLKDLPLALGAIILVGASAALLMQLPGMSWSWWGALGGTNNVMMGDTGLPGALGVLIQAGILGLVLSGIPLFAYMEEQIFRKGAEVRSPLTNLVFALIFGCVHFLAGVPMGAALALTLGGLLLTWRYLRTFHQEQDALFREIYQRERPESEQQFAACRELALLQSLAARERMTENALISASTLHTQWNYLAVTLFIIASYFHLSI